MKKNDIKIETMEDVFKSISTTGKFTNVESVLDRAGKRFKQKKKEEEQNSSNLQQKKVEQDMQWKTLKEDVLSDKKDVVIDKVVLAALIKKIDDLEKTIELLKASDFIHHGRFS